MPLLKRFFSKVEKRGECWEWTGTLNESGYGIINIDGRMYRAHRLMWVWRRGPIPEGLVIDHLCRNRSCVNPAHMEVVTHRVNILRGNGASARQARKTHCVRGHEFTTENTLIYRAGRRCRACNLIRLAEKYADPEGRKKILASHRTYYLKNAERIKAKERERSRLRREAKESQ